MSQFTRVVTALVTWAALVSSIPLPSDNADGCVAQYTSPSDMMVDFQTDSVWLDGKEAIVLDFGSRSQVDVDRDEPVIRANVMYLPFYENGTSAGHPIVDVTPCDDFYSDVWTLFAIPVPADAEFDSIQDVRDISEIQLEAKTQFGIENRPIVVPGSTINGDSSFTETAWFRNSKVSFINLKAMGYKDIDFAIFSGDEVLIPVKKLATGQNARILSQGTEKTASSFYRIFSLEEINAEYQDFLEISENDMRASSMAANLPIVSIVEEPSPKFILQARGASGYRPTGTKTLVEPAIGIGKPGFAVVAKPSTKKTTAKSTVKTTAKTTSKKVSTANGNKVAAASTTAKKTTGGFKNAAGVASAFATSESSSQTALTSTSKPNSSRSSSNAGSTSKPSSGTSSNAGSTSKPNSTGTSSNAGSTSKPNSSGTSSNAGSTSKPNSSGTSSNAGSTSKPNSSGSSSNAGSTSKPNSSGTSSNAGSTSKPNSSGTSSNAGST
ncbi:hypothetical protein HDU97_008016, partial [Phlyctochytrium planicorne]